MSEAAVKQYIKTASLKELDVLEEIIAMRREKAEIDAAITRGIKDFEEGRYMSAEEFVKRTDKYIEQAKGKKCRVTA